MTYFAAAGMATPVFAGGATLPALPQGVLSAHLLTQPEIIEALVPGAKIAKELGGATFVERKEAWERAPDDADYQKALQMLSSIGQGVMPGEGTASASFERARRFYRKIQKDRDSALKNKNLVSDKNLGGIKDKLEKVLAEQPDLSGGSLKQWRKAGKASRDFVKEVRKLARDVYSSYNGYQATDKLTGSDQFVAVNLALKALYGQRGEILMEQIRREVLEEIIRKRYPRLLYAFRSMGHLSLYAHYRALEREMTMSLFGSPERIEFFWTLRAVELEMSRREDFDPHAFDELEKEINLPDLSPKERDRFLELHERVILRASEDDDFLKLELYDGLAYFSRRVREHPIPQKAAQNFAYRDSVQKLALLALGAGMSPDVIREATRDQGPEASGEEVNLHQIYEHSHQLKPTALPSEIVRIAEETGSWKLIKIADRIVLMPEIEATENVKLLIGTMPSGRAYFSDGTIVVATTAAAKKGRHPLYPWQIVGLAGHEAWHLKIMTRVGKEPERLKAWMTNVGQERETHAWEAKYYWDYLQTHKNLGLDEKVAIKQAILNTESVVHACNMLLGIDLMDLDYVDLDSGRALPDYNQKFARFGGILGSQIDRDVYPTRLTELIGRIQMVGLLDEMQLSDLRSKLQRQIERFEETLWALYREREANLPPSTMRSKEQTDAQEQLKEEIPRIIGEYRQKFGIESPEPMTEVLRSED